MSRLEFVEVLHEFHCLDRSHAAVVGPLQLVPQMDHLGRHVRYPVLQDLELLEGLLYQTERQLLHLSFPLFLTLFVFTHSLSQATDTHTHTQWCSTHPIGPLQLCYTAVVLILLFGTHVLQFVHTALVPLPLFPKDLDAALEDIQQGLRIERLHLILAQRTYTSPGVALGQLLDVLVQSKHLLIERERVIVCVFAAGFCLLPSLTGSNSRTVPDAIIEIVRFS